MEESRNLLLTTNLSVTEVVYEVGFKFPQSFHKLFQKKVNISPLSFRNQFK
ncbi:helix-turn-helix domain-containing protein [Chryseobacterium sp.]|uniref:helix-turn-helix domain-containing protein n=1 Tax=Chryseobacterium sp. TaxID=1871047 RepID=UPI0035C782B0